MEGVRLGVGDGQGIQDTGKEAKQSKGTVRNSEEGVKEWDKESLEKIN